MRQDVYFTPERCIITCQVNNNDGYKYVGEYIASNKGENNAKPPGTRLGINIGLDLRPVVRGDQCDQGQHGLAQSGEFVGICRVQVECHYAEYEHHQEEDDHEIEHVVFNGRHQGSNDYLEALNEGYGPQNS